jgi:NodT family efflux transporter outer membrane factor (OMF) lipoprotein
MRHLLALAALALLAAGCAAVGPNYHLPTEATINAPAAQGRFVGAANNAAVSQDEGPDAWWRLYDDPRLDALVQAALAANTDLRVAEANLERSRALLQEAKAARRPRIAFSGVEEEAQLSAQAYLLDQPIPVTGLYDVGLNVSYDLDLFGRIRRGIEAARADDEAVEAARDLVRVNVAAEVTRAYVDACGSGAEIAAARRILALQQQSFGQTQRLVHAGRGSALDLVRSQGLIDQSRANIPTLLARQRNAAFRLATLTGRPPAAFDQSLERCADAPVLKQPIPVGDGASLLKRRPDVRAAERRLAAATALTGVRTAALYPDVSLGASVGSTGANRSAFSDITNFWSIGPSISWTLDHTADRARIEEAKAETKADLARFDGTVLTALRETESALNIYSHDLERDADLQAAAARARQAFADAARLQRAGRTTALATLDAERTEANLEQAGAASKTQLAADQVALFLALGGGWKSTPVQMTAAR